MYTPVIQPIGMVRDNSTHGSGRRSFLKSVGALGITATAGVAVTSGSAAAVQVEEPTQWTEDMVNAIERTEDTSSPYLDHDPVQIAEEEGYWVWDTWPLRNRDGSMTQIDGWQIIFSLVADKSKPEINVPGDRHNFARVGYFYSRNGKSGGGAGWEFGGEVFDMDRVKSLAPGANQTWAGSAMWDDEKEEINLFYTVANALPEAKQRLALAKGVTVETSPQGVHVSQADSHHILAEAGDSPHYEEIENSTGIITGFRDPWYFQHPETGEDWILFEGNTPTDNDVFDHPLNYNGNIGAARATSDDLTEWELWPPIIDATGVSQQLERPHAIFQDGKWYIFFITHEFTFAPQLWSEGGQNENGDWVKAGEPPGPEGLYGFVADGLYDSNMQPLNKGGLAVANPESAPFQTYSWLAMPHGSGSVVESFVNFRDVDTLDHPGEKLKEAFGGTLAPSLKVDINGTETSVQAELQDGHFPPSVGARSRSNGKGTGR